MPGQDDLTNMTLPQQPLMPVNVPRTLRYASRGMVVLASNPHECEIGRVRLLGHSGQPIDDICRFTTSRSLLPATLDASTSTALAPTGSQEDASSGAGESAVMSDGATGNTKDTTLMPGVKEQGAPDGIVRARLLANTCMWRHLAPTAPDTLASYPFSEMDPFVMESEDEDT